MHGIYCTKYATCVPCATMCHFGQDINLVINYDPPEANAVETETVLVHAGHDLDLLVPSWFLLSVDLESHGASYRHVSTDFRREKCFEQKQDGQDYVPSQSAGLAVQGARARPSPFCEKVGHLDTLEHTLRETVMDTRKHIKCIPACMQSKSLDVDVLLEP